ncbi:MAG: SCP2 sterol-binding domain-containing protein [Promethearchaeota archaeon]
MSDKIAVPYPSIEWAEKYMDMLNNDPDYEKAAQNWEGDMLFVIRADGNNTPIDLGVWLDLWHGKCRGYKFWMQGMPLEAEYVFEGPETNWLAMVDGKIDPIQGLMTGKFKLQGNMSAVMRAVAAAQILVETLQKFDLFILKPDTRDTSAKTMVFRGEDGEPVLVVDTEKKEFDFKK